MADVGVRPARRTDAAAVADIQVRAWRAFYRDLLPGAVLDEVTSPAARDVWRERWAESISAPPSPRHRVLVAVAGSSAGGPPPGPPGAFDLVVGFAAHAPAEDADAAPGTAELLTLLVDPAHTGAGHGSRLLAATVDLLREDGAETLITWVFEADEAMRTFLGSAGWAPDGSSRTLDMGEPVRQIRLHTDIREPRGRAEP